MVPLYFGHFFQIDLNSIKEVHRELSYLFSTVFELHDSIPNVNLTLDEVKSYFYTKYPTSSKDIYEPLFEALQGIQITQEVGLHILGAVRKRQEALNLSETAFKVAQGVVQPEELSELLVEWGKVDHKQQGNLTPVVHDLEELIEQTYSKQGVRWRLDCLNKSLGSLRDGDFGFIFARPETGKTTFLASEIGIFLTQTGNVRPIIWFNNEEDGNKVQLRIYQAFFGATLEQILSNKKRYNDEFKSVVGNKFQLYDSATIHRKDVERIIAAENPSVVVYDQIDKIKGFNNDREDLRLGSIYQWARELAKGSHAAIGVCQADGTAEGVRYLTMDHVSNAKTSKQAEADWILGIGKSHDPTEENIRFLNISKNKLFGDQDSIPNLKHGRFEVLIQPQIARYQDIVQYK